MTDRETLKEAAQEAGVSMTDQQAEHVLEKLEDSDVIEKSQDSTVLQALKEARTRWSRPTGMTEPASSRFQPSSAYAGRRARSASPAGWPKPDPPRVWNEITKGEVLSY